MSTRNAFLMALVLALATTPAFAQGKGKGGGAGSHGQGKSGSAHVERAPGGSGHHHATVNEPGPDKRPAGWNEGKKVGWGDCNVPPGLAKKRGCNASGLSGRERAAKRSKQSVHVPVRSTSTTRTKPQASSTSGTTRTTTKTTATSGTRSRGGSTNTKPRPVRE